MTERGFSTEEYREWLHEYNDRLLKLEFEQLSRIYQLLEELGEPA